ncbi:hypothetical protein ACJJTC_012583 [Scirpophaga incertulas]
MSKAHTTSDKTLHTIRTRKKLGCFLNIYAGVIFFFVPSVLCNSGALSDLTYDTIFNSTKYAQLQRVKPYIPVHSISNNHIDDSSNVESNELEAEQHDDGDKNEILLIGFARDPFRYSIPEKDYLRGVRYINPQSLNKIDNRGKRGVFHLYNMLQCATGCEPLTYKGYGCYCGFLGSGRPADGIDRCCKMHDKCYENIYCPFFTVYFQPYYWTCYRGDPLCAVENHKSDHYFINGCASRLCDCDRRFAMCIKKYSCPRSRALCRTSPIRLLQNILMKNL